MKNKMAYLGPRGTFCEEAALRYANEHYWELVPYPSIKSVFAAVNRGEIDSGIVPIENSCEGAVNQTLDLLAYEYNLKVSGEVVMPVKQNLLIRPNLELKEISRILSHPQALAQCRKYLSANFEDIEFMDVASTAEAARRVANSAEPWAAVGTEGAAQAYGLVIISPDIQDQLNNETRFIIISKDSSTCASSDGSCLHAENTKTSLLLYLLNTPGALFHALEQFYLHDINLSKIESRPAQTRIGDYLFFIDIEGHQLEPRVKEALEGLKTLAHDVRILGSYPSATGRANCLNEVI
ncbi:MAG: prephenate dehydratase [Firmicutes bacterium HGW-Firmicutes-15]|nr:MAG: prephenate dehydratase [Firmicutes bacterium HGW-Firmicutes-15]